MVSEEIYNQALTAIKGAKQVAIMLPEEVSIDILGSAAALQMAIKSLDNTALIFSANKTIPKPAFFKEPPVVQASVTGIMDQFAVKISTTHAKPGELRYEMEPDAVVIYLKAKEGQFSEGDVSVVPSSAQKFDLLITLGVSSLEQLGGLYTEQPNAFFGVPMVNIDTNPANEYFAPVNVVSVTDSGVSEVVMELLTQ
ncbi:MAG: hypothetical protein M3Q64_02115, partial [bacterium]|nr:hypothetical protein [bacterium]